MSKDNSHKEDLERITLSTSNVSVDNLAVLSQYYGYGDNKTFALRLILEEFVDNQEMIADFYKYYHNVYLSVRSDGVSSSSIQKTYYVTPEVLEKFYKIIRKVGKGLSRQNLLSEMVRAVIHYFNKIKIEDEKKNINKFIKNLEKSSSYKIKAYKFTNVGIVVTLDLIKKTEK